MVVGVVCLVLAVGLAYACAGSAMAVAHAPAATPASTSTFVSQYPLDDANQLDRYSLASGRRLGVLVRIPALKPTIMSSTVSTPHLLADGDYLLTVDHGEVCGSSHGGCHRVLNSCVNRVETLDPVSGKVQPLFSVPGVWRVLDAVPSPDGGSVALVEYSCSGYGSQLVVRDLATGLSQVVTRQLSACGLESDVTWNPSSTALVFAYAANPNLDALPAGCRLATAGVGGETLPASWAKIALRPSCGFDASAFDSIGIVAIVGCSDKYGGTNSTIVQYNGQNRVLYRHELDGFDPPQYGLATQLESDPLAHTVLVSEDVSDDPDDSDVWTFNGTKLHLVRDYFGDALLAEP
jgi:hypothetical protein